MKSVGSYEAKTHLPRLLQEVAEGEVVTITKHGVPVARLVPVGKVPSAEVAEAIAAWRRFRAGIHLGPDLAVRDLIEQGRR